MATGKKKNYIKLLTLQKVIGYKVPNLRVCPRIEKAPTKIFILTRLNKFNFQLDLKKMSIKLQSAFKRISQNTLQCKHKYSSRLNRCVGKCNGTFRYFLHRLTFSFSVTVVILLLVCTILIFCLFGLQRVTIGLYSAISSSLLGSIDSL